MTVAGLIDYLKNFDEGKEILIDGYDVDDEDINHIIYEDSVDSVNIDTEMVKICHNAVPDIFMDEFLTLRKRSQGTE